MFWYSFFWRQDSFRTINHFCKMWQVVFHLDSLFPFAISLPFGRPTDHFTKLSIASTVQQGSNFGCTGIPWTLFLKSKAEGGRTDYPSSDELSIARRTYLTETAESAKRVTAQAGDAATSHGDCPEAATNIQTSESQMEGNSSLSAGISEESVQHSLLFRAIKLPRSKHLLNRHSGFKWTKMLYTFFSFHLIYLLWVFWI